MDVICGFIVDDGVPSRGHRNNIFNNAFKSCGVCSGPHRQYRCMTAVDFAAFFG
jgi:uncharacterized protein YkwD